MMLRSNGMDAAYAAAWDEWAGTEDAAYWDMTSSDGLSDALTWHDEPTAVRMITWNSLG